jgi:hypothetical protein
MRNFARLSFAFAAMLLATAVASARPGTPNNERAWECYLPSPPPGLSGYVTLVSTGAPTKRQYDGPPQVCVVFTNTATEEVRFEVELKENGRPVGKIGTGGVGCIFFKDPINAQRLSATNCAAAHNFGGYRVPTTHAVDGPQTSGSQAAIFGKVSFDTEYCFRFRARDASNEMVSLKWSNWTCVRTAAAPPKPLKPKLVGAAAVEPAWSDDLTTLAPHRIVVDWGIVKPETVGHFTLEAKAVDPKYKVIESLVSPETEYAPSERQASFNVPPGMIALNKGEVPELLITVCAHNVAGAACSSAKSTAVTDPGKYRDPGDFNPDMVEKPKPPARTGDPGTIGAAQADNPYIADAKPKGSSQGGGGIFARPKQSKNTSDMYAAPAAAPPGGLIVRSAEATAPANFAATWDTITAANGRYTMTLKQTGVSVTGSYVGANGGGGSLAGSVEGDTLTYRWEEGANSGAGKFKLSADGASFSGWWNYSATNPDAVDGSWNGTRK